MKCDSTSYLFSSSTLVPYGKFLNFFFLLLSSVVKTKFYKYKKQQSLAISSSFNYNLKDEKKKVLMKKVWLIADFFFCPWDYFDADLIVR